MVLHGIWALSIKCSFMAHSTCQFGLVDPDPSGLRDLFRSVRTAIGIAENRPLFLVMIDFASVIDSHVLPTCLPWISPPGVSWKGHVQGKPQDSTAHLPRSVHVEVPKTVGSDQRVQGHWLAYLQSISAWPLATIACWTFLPSINSSATVLSWRSVVILRMLTV